MVKDSSNWGFSSSVQELWEVLLAENAGLPLRLARVINQNHHEYSCALPNDRVLNARVSGAFRNRQKRSMTFPVVGDWVGIDLLPDTDEGLIVDIVPRSGGVRRWAAGDATREQLIAANLDYILLVFGLDGGRNFLSSMLERSLTAVWNSGAEPIVVLNKIDCASEKYIHATREEAESLVFGLPVHLVSAKTLEGIDALAGAIEPGKTVAMLGKSGVGKSAIVNAMVSLYSQQQPGPAMVGPAIEGAMRSDGQGRHTTTNSQLYPLPWGAFIVDVPGLRELKIWSDEDNLARSFPDIEGLILKCRFRNCSHSSEPGCAVQGALKEGLLNERRYESYKKLQREIQYLLQRQNERTLRDKRRKKSR